MLADLSLYQNKNRLLVVFAPSATDSRAVRQVRTLEGYEKGLRERNLLRIVVLKGSVSVEGRPASTLRATRIRRKYGIAPGEFRALLIGKDGTVAFSSKGPVLARTIFARIDRMPMRIDEMKRGRSGG